MVFLEQEDMARIVARLKSSSIEERLAALQESVKIRKDIFKGCSTIDEWAKAALVVEQLYAFTCEILNAKPIRIGELDETDNIQVGEKASSAPRRNKLEQIIKPSRKEVSKKQKEIEKTKQFENLLTEFSKMLQEKEHGESQTS